MSKYILVIGDGMADNPVPELGGRTPLEAANIPHMDALAKNGFLGRVRTVPAGQPPGSDTAILSILGCDPDLYYTGRAPLEAAAAGISLAPVSAAYRCNMITLSDGDMPYEEKLILSHSAGSIEGDVSEELIKWLFEKSDFVEYAARAGMTVHPAKSFRHIAEQAGADIDGIVLTPPHDHLGEAAGRWLPAGCLNAEVLTALQKKAHELLDGHPINDARRREGKMPANGIWFWAEGTAVTLPDFCERYLKTGAVVSAVPLCMGIARLTGLEQIYVEGATGELDTNYEGKVDAAIEALTRHDFVCVHIEAPDECTHNGDLPGKLQAIEWLDSRVIGPLCDRLDSSGADYAILILSDHKTLTLGRNHDGDPVPFVIWRSGQTGTGGSYCEKDGEAGPFTERGTELLPMLFSV